MGDFWNLTRREVAPMGEKVTLGEILDALAEEGDEDSEVVIVVDGKEYSPVVISADYEGKRVALSNG